MTTALARSGATKLPQDLTGHGRHIFMYLHRRTNQVIYSLTRNMNNNNAMKQLPYLGKKSKPPALRRDLWTPLATVRFPNDHQGQIAYRELREYRKRHELEWPKRLKLDEDGNPVPTRVLARRIADQRANSVADLAAVLCNHERIVRKRTLGKEEEAFELEKKLESMRARLCDVAAEMKAEAKLSSPEVTQKYKSLKTERMYLRAQIQKLEQPKEQTAAAKQLVVTKRKARRLVKVETPDFSMDGIAIEWSNLDDKSFAEAWPEAVQHSCKHAERKLRIYETLNDLPDAEDALYEAEAEAQEKLIQLEEEFTRRESYDSSEDIAALEDVKLPTSYILPREVILELRADIVKSKEHGESTAQESSAAIDRALLKAIRQEEAAYEDAKREINAPVREAKTAVNALRQQLYRKASQHVARRPDDVLEPVAVL